MDRVMDLLPMCMQERVENCVEHNRVCQKLRGQEFEDVDAVVEKEHRYHITLDKAGRGTKLGAGVSSKPTVMITSIDGGLIGAWNAKHPLSAVHIGDTIVEVNGVNLSPGDILREIAHAEAEVILTLARIS
mmetsp:Transcript_31190/g.72417  ORF Transcript_31190/g.72417 Transcript_31190/m.72417 type:complete len:131 (+) Transcript_31190:79-471(+)